MNLSREILGFHQRTFLLDKYTYMARIKPLQYGIAPNDLLNNKNISLSAKGMYTFMNCKPENWEFSINGLISQLKEGKDKIKSMLKELENYGYLKRKKYQTSNGRWAWEYILLLADLPATDLPAMVLPAMENTPHISKKELSKKDIVKKKETITSNEVIEIIEKFNQTFNKSYRVTPDRSKKIKLRLKSYTLDEIKKAIDNLKQSKFHNGKNDRGWVATIDFLIRNDEKIDEFLNSKQSGENYYKNFNIK